MQMRYAEMNQTTTGTPGYAGSGIPVIGRPVQSGNTAPNANTYGEPVLSSANMCEVNFARPPGPAGLGDPRYSTGVAHQLGMNPTVLQSMGIITVTEHVETPPWTEIIFAAVLTIFFFSFLTCIPLFIACTKASESDQCHKRGLTERGNLAARQARRWMKCLYATLALWLIVDIILLMSLRESPRSSIPIPGFGGRGNRTEFEDYDESAETPRTTPSPGE